MESAPGTIRVAAVQMESENGLVAANLERATAYVEQAERSGARLILLPEFLPTGYAWTEAIWDAAEPADGPTAAWLGATSRRLGVYLGTSFLEAEGDDFYDTFVLTTPEGREAGRVRKQTPALWEAFFFKGEPGPHLIRTEIGTIGVGICYENHLAWLLPLMSRNAVDLVLMPHSAPSMTETFPMCRSETEGFRTELRDVAAYYATKLGVPAVMANKCGPWRSGLPFEKPSRFLGLSSIADSDGRVAARLDDEAGVITADVHIEPARKTTSPVVNFGRWASHGSIVRSALCWLPENLGRVWYTCSARRKRRARKLSARRSAAAVGS